MEIKLKIEAHGIVKPPPGTCRVCGCTEDHACMTHDGCYWIEPGLCSACVLTGSNPTTPDGIEAAAAARRPE